MFIASNFKTSTRYFNVKFNKVSTNKLIMLVTLLELVDIIFYLNENTYKLIFFGFQSLDWLVAVLKLGNFPYSCSSLFVKRTSFLVFHFL